MLKISRSISRSLNRLLARSFDVQLVRATPRVKTAGYEIRSKPPQPLYLNIGAGKWRHPFWHNLDHPVAGYEKSQGHVDISHDLMSDKPFDVAPGSLAAAYTSHTIEHLNDESALRLFKNVYTCLAPGGYFRITCPDAALAYSAYRRGDRAFWAPHDQGHSLEQLFLSVFSASSSSIMETESGLKVADEEVRRVFDSLPMCEAMDHFTKTKPIEVIAKYPQSHDTWFTVDKVLAMVREAGFESAWESRYGQSHFAPMRDLGYFDTTRPDISLFIECRKG